jgi:radical SAM protein with 4Fe4S-binding SPASM domain
MGDSREKPYSGYEGFPFIVGWELTLECNLHCAHCGSTAGKPRYNELTLDEALDLCDQFPDLLVQEVDFTGGEPLLYKHWPKLASRIKKQGIPVKLLTNGVNFSQQTVSQIIDLGLDAIGFSLDGLASTHDQLRGQKGLFQEVLAGIKMLRKANIPVTIITTINALNLKELPELLEILISEGIKYWQVQPLFPLGRGAENSRLHLSDEEYLAMGDFIVEKSASAHERGLEIMPSDSVGYFTERDKRKPAWGGCPAGLYSCGITSNGKVKGCLSLPDELIEGDLRERTLWDIWFSLDSFPYTRRFTAGMEGVNCRDCERLEQCQGGCSAMSYSCTGQFHNNPMCFLGIEKKITANL